MVKLGTASPWLWRWLVAAVNLSASFVGADQLGGTVIPGAFLVEYEDNVNVDAATASIDGVAETRMKLDYELFKGASIRFENVETADIQASTLVETNPAIKNVWPMRVYSMPKYEVHWTGAEDAGAEVAAARARQSSADALSTHVMTQVDKLRDQGFVGKGIKVAIIDSGIDYLHPDLGGCFGEGCLVSSGYDFVGDDYNGAIPPVPDPDPQDCSGHGTHVAGIIAAQANNPWGIVGAAAGVELGAYRVFGCEGGAAIDVLIAAYNMAYESGADIITASIGGVSGWTEAPWTSVVSRIVEKGVPCPLSAGNDGEYGLFYTGGAADGKRATAVASFDNSLGLAFVRNASYTTTQGSEGTIRYTVGTPANWGNVTLPLFATSFNTSLRTDGCDPLPDDTPDLSGYIVLIRRGTCVYAQKFQNAADKGARYVLVYNNVNYGLPLMQGGETVGGLEAVAMVSAEQGVAWIASLSAGQNVTVTMPDPSTTDPYLYSPTNEDSGGFVSYYSTWGPTFELDFKPQFGTPGGMIMSTFPTKDGSYAVLSGTSMACPLAAGIYALMMSVRGTKDPKTLENLLSATAKPNLYNNGTTTFPVLAPTVQQGAGLAQVYDAAYATTLLSVSSLAFNDTDNIVAAQDFSIENTSNTTVTYTLGHVTAATVYTFGEGDIYPAPFPTALDAKVEAASLAFDVENPLTIPAGGRKIITVTCTPPASLDGSRLPVYSGYIVINGSDSSALSLPYMGVAGSMKSTALLDASKTYLTSTLASDSENSTSVAPALAPGRTFLLPPIGASNDTEFQANITDYPLLQWSLFMGSAVVRLDVVPVSVPTETNITESLGLRTIGDVFNSPFTYYERTRPTLLLTYLWDGRLANGDYAPEGTYKLVLRALKIFGDRNNADDYEVAETVDFGIKYMSSTSPSARRARGAAKRAPGVTKRAPGMTKRDLGATKRAKLSTKIGNGNGWRANF